MSKCRIGIIGCGNAGYFMKGWDAWRDEVEVVALCDVAAPRIEVLRKTFPELSALDAEGARFSNALTPIPVCSAACACLLTGRAPSQVGIHDCLALTTKHNDWPGDETNLYKLLGNRKYFRGQIGKWYMRTADAAPRGVDC